MLTYCPPLIVTSGDSKDGCSRNKSGNTHYSAVQRGNIAGARGNGSAALQQQAAGLPTHADDGGNIHKHDHADIASICGHLPH